VGVVTGTSPSSWSPTPGNEWRESGTKRRASGVQLLDVQLSGVQLSGVEPLSVALVSDGPAAS